MNTDEWNDVPSPVRTAAFLAITRQACEQFSLKDLINEPNPHETYASIIFAESFYESNLPTKRSDVGLTQLSPEAREVLSQRSLFKNFTRKDFINPYNSIMAGTYWFKLDLINAGKNVSLAIKSYNIGLFDARRNITKALEYEENVLSVKNKYFNRDSPDYTKSVAWDIIRGISDKIQID